MGMDVHAGTTVLGAMNSQGEFVGKQRFDTSEKGIAKALGRFPAKTKYLALEESTLAHWAAQVARPHVSDVLICDPRHNALIYGGAMKRDPVDTEKLCRLLRLGELKQVYHAQEDHRAIFKAAVQHYLDLRGQQVELKQKIKAMYRHWGVVRIPGEGVYGSEGRKEYLKQIKPLVVRNELKRLYAILDQTEQMQALAAGEMKRLARRYPEIKEFKKIPGIGVIGAITFDAFVQTPERFPDKHTLWRYCRLGIIDRSSDGKPLGYRRLDRSGIGELKAVSYRAWLNAQKGNNEVRQFYHASLQRTHSRTHARLNTQRKIIAVMYGVWKRGEEYSAEVFLGSSD
jgi:transposase